MSHRSLASTAVLLALASSMAAPCSAGWTFETATGGDSGGPAASSWATFEAVEGGGPRIVLADDAATATPARVLAGIASGLGSAGDDGVFGGLGQDGFQGESPPIDDRDWASSAVGRGGVVAGVAAGPPAILAEPAAIRSTLTGLSMVGGLCWIRRRRGRKAA